MAIYLGFDDFDRFVAENCGQILDKKRTKMVIFDGFQSTTRKEAKVKHKAESWQKNIFPNVRLNYYQQKNIFPNVRYNYNFS